MIKEQEITDSELIMLYNENSDEAKNILYDRYGYIINVIINKYNKLYRILNIDEQELFSEASVGFSDAINNYRDNKNASVATFITLVIERRLYKLVKKYQSDKHRVNANSVSLDYTYDQLDRPLIEIISDDINNDPLNNLQEEENFNELMINIKSVLSDGEFEVFELMLKYYNYREIAQILQKSDKQVDNTMQRIRNKIKEIINE